MKVYYAYDFEKWVKIIILIGIYKNEEILTNLQKIYKINKKTEIEVSMQEVKIEKRKFKKYLDKPKSLSYNILCFRMNTRGLGIFPLMLI